MNHNYLYFLVVLGDPYEKIVQPQRLRTTGLNAVTAHKENMADLN